MRPAAYIDMDCDLYFSARDVLTWMLDNKLIVKGTIIYFDDWGSRKEYAGGESRAWKDACEKYGIEYKILYSRNIPNSGQRVMEILCVNG